jgi:undecaprenyl diphosphate synthase
MPKDAPRRGRTGTPAPPTPHSSGARPPVIPAKKLPQHVAIVMDGNGRWAKARNLPRTEGHSMGEASLFDVIEGAIEVGVRYLSAYAFSTENWSRSPDEVRWLMGFNRDVIRRRRDQMDAMGVRVRWAGRRPRLWRSVISELDEAERRTVDNDVLTLQFCVNYGGRAEIVDAVKQIARDVKAGKLNPERIDQQEIAERLYAADMPEPDLLIRTSGEMRISNFLVWEAAYSELWFTPIFWPDFNREHLFEAIRDYQKRDRRFGAIDEDA